MIGLLEGDASARQSKLCGRLPLTPEASLLGMEVAPSGSADDLGLVWRSPGRSIPLRAHNSLPSVVFFDGDQCPAWDGCSRQHMARESPFCIPSDPSDNAHASQSEILESQGPPGGRQVALKDMVLHTLQSVRQRSLAAPSEDGHPVPAGGEGLASISEPSPTLGMAIEGNQPLLTGLEPSICKTLQSARAPSTRLVYGNCWAAFSSWSCPLQDIQCNIYAG